LGFGGLREGVGGKRRGGEKGGEMTQTLYAHMNKIKIKKKQKLKKKSRQE
jgi:murein DD-endopeptidase MepM/ murein hydrolase activator NlpD